MRSTPLLTPLVITSALASALAGAGCSSSTTGGGSDQSGGSSSMAAAGTLGSPTGGQSSNTGGAPSSTGGGGVYSTGGTPYVGGAGANAGGAPGGGVMQGGGGMSTGGGGTTGTTGGAGGKGMGGSSAGGAGGGGMSSAGNGAGGGAAGGGSVSNCNVSPVDPQATQQAKNLLCYLYSIYGNHVLSGQQETSWSNPADDISFYTGNSGIKKAPAILGGDFLYTGTGTASQGTTTSRAQAYWAAGGLTMIRYHMGAPPNADSYANAMLKYTSAQCDAVVTSGTAENTSYISKLNGIATNLQTLQTAGVAVILALFHETQPNGWFWWSTCSGPQFIKLYTYTYDYLVKTKGIHNIVRLMPYSGSPSGTDYPGKALVDITGGDTYGTNVPFTQLYSTCKGIGGSTIPLALHETGMVPQPSTMFPTAAPWLLWNIWAGYEKNNNSIANITSAYSSTYTITRDEVPNLK